MKYCKVFELSSCNVKICCSSCQEDNCKERCKYNPSNCGDSTESPPLSFYEIMEELNEDTKNTRC